MRLKHLHAHTSEMLENGIDEDLEIYMFDSESCRYKEVTDLWLVTGAFKGYPGPLAPASTQNKGPFLVLQSISRDQSIDLSGHVFPDMDLRRPLMHWPPGRRVNAGDVSMEVKIDGMMDTIKMSNKTGEGVVVKVPKEGGLKTLVKARRGIEAPIVAFSVQADDSGVIIFERTNIAARRIGANELGVEFSEIESCRRAQWADKYLDKGPIPVSAYLAEGWHWSCNGCGKYCRERDKGIIVEDVAVYCSRACRDDSVEI